MVRHASAGDRSKWAGDQRLRPLDERGRRQAELLVTALADEGVGRIIASTHLRCVQTVEPLAASRGLVIERDERLAEGEERAAVELARSLLDADVVLASHGDVIPAIVRAAGHEGVDVPNQVSCDFASTWILTGRDGRFDTARYVEVG